MPPFRASVVPACAAAFLAAAVLAGCTSTRLSAQAPPGVRLAGDWRLDSARSDDLGKALDALRAQVRREQADRRQRAESSSGPQGLGPGLALGPSPGTSPVDELMSNVPRGDYLRITVTSSAFTVVSGDASNEYTPGLESEISAEQGDALQTSGWKGAEYVIDTKPQWGAEIIQSYGLTQDGRLAVTVRLTGRGTNLAFTRIYDRTTRVAPLAPPTIN